MENTRTPWRRPLRLSLLWAPAVSSSKFARQRRSVEYTVPHLYFQKRQVTLALNAPECAQHRTEGVLICPTLLQAPPISSCPNCSISMLDLKQSMIRIPKARYFAISEPRTPPTFRCLQQSLALKPSATGVHAAATRLLTPSAGRHAPSLTDVAVGGVRNALDELTSCLDRERHLRRLSRLYSRCSLPRSLRINAFI